MKRFVLLLFVCGLALQCVGQVLTPKRLELLQSDAYAQINSRTDRNGKKCAVIRFTVVGVYDLKFKEAVGDVVYANNEYIVYLPEGTNVLTCSNKSLTKSFDLDNYTDISAGKTYRFTIDTDNRLRSIVFRVNPTNATVKVNDKNVSIDRNGNGSINLPIGTYSYTVSAEGYRNSSGSVSLSEREMYVTKDIVLQQNLIPVTIGCKQSDVQVFVDGKNVGQIKYLGKQLMLPKGKHEVRVIKEGYKEWSETIKVADVSLSLNIDLIEIKAKTIVHDEERTKSNISLRPHTDIVYGGQTFLYEPIKSSTVKIAVYGNNYAGHFSVKYGLSFGGTFLSDSIGRKIDNYYDQVLKPNESGHKNRLAFSAEIPLQIGFAAPLSRYNTSQVTLLGGMYGAYHYIGHGSGNVEDEKNSVSTHTFDFGIKASVNFYFNRFIMSIEGNQSLSKHHLGTSVGIGLGCRIFGKKEKK